MEMLINSLKNIPEYKSVLETVSRNQAAAVTGIGQINRSHMIAGLRRHQHAPLVSLCQDDLAAKKLQEELNAFLGESVPVLPSRELTLYDAAVVSRSWEQKRLRQLYDLRSGNVPLQIMTWEALSQRTIPPEVLSRAAFCLEVGKEYTIDSLTQRLTRAGYSRCGMVEGPGQFAIRGGILDVYSPAADRPFRAAESEGHAIRVGRVVVVGVAVAVDITEVGRVAAIRRALPPVVR